MASIEFIQKRIAGKEKEIEKLENKLARIHEVAARGWADPNPHMYDENDLRWALVDLREANSALARLRASLGLRSKKLRAETFKRFSIFWRAGETGFSSFMTRASVLPTQKKPH